MFCPDGQINYKNEKLAAHVLYRVLMTCTDLDQNLWENIFLTQGNETKQNWSIFVEKKKRRKLNTNSLSAQTK